MSDAAAIDSSHVDTSRELSASRDDRLDVGAGLPFCVVAF